jgi:MFS family permease
VSAVTTAAAPTTRAPPTWIWGLTAIPYGVVGSFAGLLMPYLTRRSGIDVEEIGWYVTLLLLPPMLQFLYAPVVDFGPRRKHWLVIVSAISSVCIIGACVTPLPDQLTLFLALAFAAQTISGLVGSCNGGLMATTIPDHLRGKAGAWYNIGNLCGGGISAAIAVYMTGHGVPAIAIGGLLAGMMVIPSLAVLFVDEPPREKVGTLGLALRSTVGDVRKVLFSRAGATGILLCLSPVGTAALVNYFGAIAEDYVWVPGMTKDALDAKVSELLAFTSGPIAQILTAVGALVGGLLCDKTNRRAMYLLSGLMTAIVGLTMAVSPRTEMTFIVGALTYALVTGFCYSAFTATVLETIGEGGTAASTQYTLFVAAGNTAIAWVGLVDTRFHKSRGVEGVIASDGLLNVAGIIILGFIFWRLGSFGKTRHAPPPAGSPPAAPDGTAA